MQKSYPFTICFATDAFPTTTTQSLFLSGPSPRTTTQDSSTWRYQALDILAEKNFTGLVFIPIPKATFFPLAPTENGTPLQNTSSWTYDNQVQWEVDARRMCDIELFWVHRAMPTVPGLTTNCEFTESLPHGKMVYGRPNTADNIRYLDQRYTQHNPNPITKQPLTTLSDTIDAALTYLHRFENTPRSGFDALIPLHIWHHRPFQAWLQSQKSAGNSLHALQPLQSFFINSQLFSSVIKVKVWIEREQRFKDNEFITTRFDMSTVVAWAYHPDTNEKHTLLVSEFRSPVRNESNAVLEFPGGSSFNPKKNPLTIACAEIHEETSVQVNPEDLISHGFIQSASTLSAHGIHLYSVQLPYEQLAAVNNIQRGNAHETEQTTAFLIPVSHLTRLPGCDATTLGLALKAGLFN